MRILDETRNIQIGLNMKSCIALLLFAALLLPIGGTVAVGQSLGWVKMETKVSPPSRQGHAMTYDVDRGKVVLFGGFSSEKNAMLNDTWEWDGKEWKEVPIDPPKRPEARFLMPIVYDTLRKKVVMFGGGDLINYIGFDNTWEFDGQKWNKLNVNNPGIRYAHAMDYDAARGLVLLFGGFDINSNPLGDLWEYDGNKWIHLDVNDLPSPRAGSYLVYDSQRKKIVLFGGWDGSKALGDTWEWDGSNFQKVSDSGPDPRLQGSIAYDSERGRVVLFGGAENTYPYSHFGDTWEWDGYTWAQLNIPGPMTRHLTAMTYDKHQGKVILFGGIGRDHGQGPWFNFADTWELGLVTSGLKASLWPKY